MKETMTDVVLYMRNWCRRIQIPRPVAADGILLGGRRYVVVAVTLRAGSDVVEATVDVPEHISDRDMREDGWTLISEIEKETP